MSTKSPPAISSAPTICRIRMSYLVIGSLTRADELLVPSSGDSLRRVERPVIVTTSPPHAAISIQSRRSHQRRERRGDRQNRNAQQQFQTDGCAQAEGGPSIAAPQSRRQTQFIECRQAEQTGHQ